MEPVTRARKKIFFLGSCFARQVMLFLSFHFSLHSLERFLIKFAHFLELIYFLFHFCPILGRFPCLPPTFRFGIKSSLPGRKQNAALLNAAGKAPDQRFGCFPVLLFYFNHKNTSPLNWFY